jgi:hypothetical protein
MYVPLDVNFPDDDKIEQCSLAAVGLYAIALCVAKRTKSDGVITRIKLTRYGATDDLIDELLAVGLFVPDAGDAVRISAYLAHNPSAENLVDGSKLAHDRWHVKKGKFKPGCAHCAASQETNVQVNADGCDTHSDPHGTRTADHMRDAHAEGEEEGEGEREEENNNDHEQTETSIVPLPDASPSASTRIGDSFDDFWNRYPRKVGKPKAQAAYRSARKRATRDEILTGLDRHLPAWRRLDRMGNGDKIPHPTTWLNRDGWGDDPPPTPSVSRPSKPAENRAKIDAALARMQGAR